jgi:hypothetical protein
LLRQIFFRAKWKICRLWLSCPVSDKKFLLRAAVHDDAVDPLSPVANGGYRAMQPIWLPKRLLLGGHFAGPNSRSWKLPLEADRSALSEKFERLTAGNDQMIEGADIHQLQGFTDV